MKLSIITINKDNAKGLEQTALSIIWQTFTDYEWIVIDGASSDNSVEIIKKYVHKMSYWVSEPDTGIYNAMNKGIKRAKGDYCLFLNSGDFLIHPWTLQTVFDEICASKCADIYFSNAINDKYDIWKTPQNVTLDSFIKSTISHQNSLIRRELFYSLPYSEKYHIVSDWLFFLIMIKDHDAVFYHINTNIAIYDTTGISSMQLERVEIERKIILNKLNLTEKKTPITKKTLKFSKKIIKYILPYGLFLLYAFIRKKITDSQTGKKLS